MTALLQGKVQANSIFVVEFNLVISINSTLQFTYLRVDKFSKALQVDFLELDVLIVILTFNFEERVLFLY